MYHASNSAFRDKMSLHSDSQKVTVNLCWNFIFSNFTLNSILCLGEMDHLSTDQCKPNEVPVVRLSVLTQEYKAVKMTNYVKSSK